MRSKFNCSLLVVFQLSQNRHWIITCYTNTHTNTHTHTHTQYDYHTLPPTLRSEGNNYTIIINYICICYNTTIHAISDYKSVIA